MSKERLKLNRQSRQKFDRIHRLNQVKNMDPIEFERYVGYLYQKQGYRVAMTVTSGDEGVDLYLRRGLSTAVVQCKRYSGTVGQPTVRDLYGAMVHNKARRAILVTSGVISRPAEAWAKGKPIDLIDGHELMSWAKRSRGLNIGRLRAMWSWVTTLVIFVLLVGLLYWGVGQVGNLTVLLPTAVTPDSPILSGEPVVVRVPALQQGIVNRQITVDGNLADWNRIPEYPAAYRIEEASSWDGSDDLGATWQLAWNSKHLLVAVSVTDDMIVPQTADSKHLDGDILQLLLDTQAVDNGRVDRNSYQISLSPGDLAEILPSAQLAQGNAGKFTAVAGSGILIAVRPTDDGYGLEAAIPWPLLQTTPGGELDMWVVLEAMDSDKGKTAVPQVTYAHLPNYQMNNPITWGKMRLEQ